MSDNSQSEKNDDHVKSDHDSKNEILKNLHSRNIYSWSCSKLCVYKKRSFHLLCTSF